MSEKKSVCVEKSVLGSTERISEYPCHHKVNLIGYSLGRSDSPLNE